MLLDDKTELICSFTGHRPNALPWRNIESGERFNNFKQRLKETIIQSINDGYTHFISGMAQGIDLLVAEIILSIRKTNDKIFLECAIPCKNQTKSWDETMVNRYVNILDQANLVTFVSYKEYFKGCMQMRNKYMVDKSSRLIAVYDGVRLGGTSSTIDYAKKTGVDVKIVAP